MIALGRKINAAEGIELDPAMTPEKAREMMLVLGIRPEDNLFSRDIICARNRDRE